MFTNIAMSFGAFLTSFIRKEFIKLGRLRDRENKLDLF